MTQRIKYYVRKHIIARFDVIFFLTNLTLTLLNFRHKLRELTQYQSVMNKII